MITFYCKPPPQVSARGLGSAAPARPGPAACPTSTSAPIGTAPATRPLWPGALVLLLAAALLTGDGTTPPGLEIYGRLAGAAAGMLLAGALAGFLSGLLGIGGALVVIPALHLALPAWQVAPDRVAQVAVATSLAAMLPTASRVALVQWRRGALDLAWLRRLLPGMLAGGLLGALLAVQLKGPVLITMFAAQSLYYGSRMLFGAPPAESPVRRRVWHRLPPWTVGAGIGSFCACVGMGGGSMVVPYLNGLRVALARAAATSGALNLCIAAGGVASFAGASLGGGPVLVCWPAAALATAGALVTAKAGAACAGRLPERHMARLVGGVNLAAAAMLAGPLVAAAWPIQP